jgi:hypothetical protein
VDQVVQGYHSGFARSIQNYSQILHLFTEAKEQVGGLALPRWRGLALLRWGRCCAGAAAALGALLRLAAWPPTHAARRRCRPGSAVRLQLPASGD